MIRPPKRDQSKEPTANTEYRTFMIFQQGLLVGFLAGLLGAGGGFLIIPALVLLAKLSMKEAVGTSLTIVMINSAVGFLSDMTKHQFDWQFLFIFAGFAVIGILIGGYISKFISGQKLKPIFGYFILVVGAYIILKELFLTEI